MSGAVIDVTDETFEEEVIRRSHEVPVVVDFWAAWCGPCRSLGPVLERLAEGSEGAWVLAKLDVDANPSISSAAGIMGIPAVKAFKDGKIVEEFTGAIPEAQVRQWLKGFVADPASDAVTLGLEAEKAGQTEAARGFFEKALSIDEHNAVARVGLKRLDLLADGATEDGGVLEQRLARNPDDIEAAYRCARAWMVKGRDDFYVPLVGQVQRLGAGGTGGPRERLIELISLLPPDDPRIGPARKALANALF